MTELLWGDLEARLRHDGFTVGDWRVEPRRLRIVSEDETKSLDARLIDVLVALAVLPGEVRTRDELLSAVWKDTFVNENSLSQAISRLRRALGDDHHEPRYIETISRSGYRLVAPVNPRAVPSKPPARARWPRLSWLLAAVLATVALTLAFDRGKQPSPPVPAPVPLVRPELTLVGNQFGPRLSPDGTHVAFAWRASERESWDIWLQPVGGDSPVRATDHADHERLPAWSPDGRRLAFIRFSNAPQRCGIYSLPVVGGAAERLGDCRRGMRSLAWAPDGGALVLNGFVAEDPDPENPGVRALFRLDLRAGRIRQITDPPASIIGDTSARVSPDGTLVAFEREIGPARNDVAVTSLVTGETRSLTNDRWGQIRGLDWSSDGASVLFSSNRVGQFALWRVPVSSGVPERLPIHDAWVTQPSVARSGGRLIYRTFRDSVDLWALPLDGEGQPAGEPVRRVPSSRSERDPSWSPDAGSIAFISDRSGSSELWSGRPDGTELIRHTSLGGPIPASPAWSPDGQRILFDAATLGQADLWIVDRQSRRPKRLTFAPSDDRNGSFSRDGSRIYFASNRQGASNHRNDWQIWCMPATGGEAWRVTTDGGFLAQESHDGRHLYVARLDTPGIWRMPTSGGEAVRVMAGLELSDWGSWVVAEHGIYHVRRGPTTIEFAGFDGSPPRSVHTPSKQIPFLGRALSLSADGRALLFSLIDHSDDEVMTVDLAGL